MTLCSACCALAERQRELWAALDVWSSTPVPPDFNDRLYARIAAEKNPWWRQWTQARWPGAWRPALPVAFACAALLTAFLLKEPPAQNDATSPALEAPQIEQVERALDDVEMLKQLGLTPARANSSREEI